MSRAVNLTAQPAWSIRPMSSEQIPLVVSWIATIHPAGDIDEIDMAQGMRQEMDECHALGTCEYFIGYFQQMATFYLVGAKAEPDDYEIITLLPRFVVTEDLYLHLFHQAIQFVFEKEEMSRIIFQLDAENELRRSILLQLGFNAVDRPGDRSHTWWGCVRLDFMGR